MSRSAASKHIAIIGGGPAGLIAAEILSAAGLHVTVYDHKPSVARKFLMAGRGGLNLTHSEDLQKFLTRYGTAQDFLRDAIEQFSPVDMLAWCEGLGERTFVGSSGRVFPKSFKASPLLRAWLTRLQNNNVQFKLGHHWQGWDNQNHLIFTDASNQSITVQADAMLLALGGASWPRLGSDGSWVEILKQHNIPITPLQPANCGFVVAWSDLFRARYAGQQLKSITITFDNHTVQGDATITENGIEGGVIYALSSSLRNAIAKHAYATLQMDLRPGLTLDALTEKLRHRRGGLSFTNYLRKAGLSPTAIGLLMEQPDRKALIDFTPEQLAARIKALKLRLIATFPIERAISTAGGVKLDAVTDHFMLKTKPGVFIAGEMLDWEAPTGGYLLQACFATAVRAATGIKNFLS